MEPILGALVSVNVGGIRQFDYRGGIATSAIWKSPVSGRVAARGVNLEGDDQADRSVHGGPDKAIYAYAAEDLRWWAQALETRLDYGQFGENLSTEGEIGAGDEIRVVERPNHELSIGDVFRIFTHDRGEASRLLDVAQLSDSWRQWAASLA